MTEKATSPELKDFVDSLEEEWLTEDPTLRTEGIPVVARVVRLSYYIEQRVARNLAFYNLTRGEFEVMAVLVRNPTAAMAPKILQTKVLITSGGLSNRIKALEAKGYIVRKPDETDGRGVVLKATTKGKNVTRKALKSHLEVEKQILQGLPENDAKELARLLKALILLQEDGLNKGSLR